MHITIDSLFNIDVFLYNLLLLPKIIKKRLQYSNVLDIAKKNNELKARKRTDTIYICGNGPSLNKVDFNKIHDDYIVLNDYFRFENKNSTNPPKYYMLLDESYKEERFKERLDGIFNFELDTTFILNGVLYDRVKSDYPEQFKKSYFFCPWGRLYSHKNEPDFTKMVSRTWNVVSDAILFSIFLGYKDIRLLGCDYSVFVQNAHFYKQKQEHASLRVMLYKYCYTTHVHYEIQKFASLHGVKITNLTKNTLLDAYEIVTNSPL